MHNKFGSYSKWKKHQENIEKLEHSKLLNDEKLSRWKVKTFWWFFGLAIVGGGYSTFDFIRNPTIGEYSPQEQKTTAEMESEQSIQRISPSNQQTSDSSSSASALSGNKTPEKDSTVN